MATNNLKTLLDAAKIHPGTFSTSTHLSRHTIRELYNGKRTAAPKSQSSIVKALNALLKKEHKVEDVFPPKKQQKTARANRSAQPATA